jgi:hypothetical protein
VRCLKWSGTVEATGANKIQAGEKGMVDDDWWNLIKYAFHHPSQSSARVEVSQQLRCCYPLVCLPAARVRVRRPRHCVANQVTPPPLPICSARQIAAISHLHTPPAKEPVSDPGLVVSDSGGRRGRILGAVLAGGT